jgi:hypothetical protein
MKFLLSIAVVGAFAMLAHTFAQHEGTATIEDVLRAIWNG